jgi:hypothetical protein
MIGGVSRRVKYYSMRSETAVSLEGSKGAEVSRVRGKKCFFGAGPKAQKRPQPLSAAAFELVEHN